MRRVISFATALIAAFALQCGPASARDTFRRDIDYTRRTPDSPRAWRVDGSIWADGNTLVIERFEVELQHEGKRRRYDKTYSKDVIPIIDVDLDSMVVEKTTYPFQDDLNFRTRQGHECYRTAWSSYVPPSEFPPLERKACRDVRAGIALAGKGAEIAADLRAFLRMAQNGRPLIARAPVPVTVPMPVTAPAPAAGSGLPDVDGAVRPGVLSLYTTDAGGDDHLDLVARNGLPFDVILRSVTTTGCLNVVAEDCGTVARDVRVGKGSQALIHRVRRVSLYSPSKVDFTYDWAAAGR